MLIYFFQFEAEIRVGEFSVESLQDVQIRPIRGVFMTFNYQNSEFGDISCSRVVSLKRCGVKQQQLSAGQRHQQGQNGNNQGQSQTPGTNRANQGETGNNQGQSETNRKQPGPIGAKQETKRANQSQTGNKQGQSEPNRSNLGQSEPEKCSF